MTDEKSDERKKATVEGPGDPPEHLADAWLRYQDDDLTNNERVALYEWLDEERKDALGW